MVPALRGGAVHDHTLDDAAPQSTRPHPVAPMIDTGPFGGATGLVAGLQKQAGNEAVTALLQRRLPAGGQDEASVQRDESPSPPALGTRSPAADNPYRLHLDPEVEAQIRAIEAMRSTVAPERVHDALADLRLPTTPLTGPPPATTAPAAPPGPSTSAPTPGPAPGTGFSGPRDGTGGDVWKAVLSDPTLGPALTALGDAAGARARRDFASLSSGATVAVVSTSIAIGGGAVASLLANAEARRWIAVTLNDKIIPVPKVPGLSVQLNLSGPAVIVGLHLDVGKILPAALGFGPAVETTPLGAPPTP